MYLYFIIQLHLTTVATIHENKDFLTTTVFSDYNYILAGYQGSVRFYDWEEQNRNYDINIRKSISLGNLKVNQILFDSTKLTIYVALSNGSVMLFSHSLSPEFVLDYHDKAVNRILFDDESRILFTCSSDKAVKVRKKFKQVWQLPNDWPSESMRVDKEYNLKTIIEDHSVSSDNIMKIQDAFKDLDLKEQDSQEILDKKDKENAQEGDMKKESNENYWNHDQEDITCDDLDGWDEDQPLEPFKIKNNEALYNFMGL